MTALKGIVPPMITPLINESKLDYRGLEKLIEHLISGGVHGVFILGTTGEAPSLSHALRVDLIKYVCDQVNGRIPVLVGITDVSLKEAVHISDKSKEFGAQAVVLAPPFYYQIDQNELYHFTEQLIGEISLPVYLYNNPGLTKVSFEIETIRKLLSNPEVIGLKDSSADMVYYHRLLKVAQDSEVPLLIGPEELLMESLLIGGNGGISGGANMFPQLYVSIYDSVNSGDLNKARELQRQVMELSGIVYSGNGSSSVINGIKCVLKHMQICPNDYIVKPLNKASKDKSERINQYLTNQKLYV
ncbi:MAG: dihydrodipicolinate synthase family protein [Bacteroidales bacterium]|nr:dihydrodipicolinate synthase family protein [Bacteroidales bacterium]